MNHRPSLSTILKVMIGIEMAIVVTSSVPWLLSMGDYRAAFGSGAWAITFLLMQGLYALGWISVLRKWNHAFAIYLSGWILAMVLGAVEGITDTTPSHEILSTVTAMAGGASLVLIWLRDRNIGEWTPQAAAGA